MAIAFIGPGDPGPAGDKLLVPRDPTASPRTGRALSIIADLLNDLILDGILVMVGPGQWEVHIPTLEGVNPTVARFVANSIIVDGTNGLRVVDDGNLTGTLSLLASGMPASEITVKEVDGSPTITGVTTIAFDQADGFVVTNPSAGVARIDLSLAYSPGTLAAVKGINDTPITVSNVGEFRFDQATGGVVTSPATGVSLLSLVPASYTHWGVVTTTNQLMTGNKAIDAQVIIGNCATPYGAGVMPPWPLGNQFVTLSGGTLVWGPTGTFNFDEDGSAILFSLISWASYGSSSLGGIGAGGQFLTNQVRNRTVGSIVGRMAVYDSTSSSNLLGYFPVYGPGSFDGTTTLTGDVTGTGMGSFAATIANDAVTNAKLANMATQTFKGRTTAGTGDPEDLTVAQAQALLQPLGRLNLSAGTSIGTGDVALSGWGANATVSAVSGNDARGTITITTSALDIPTLNPTVTLTFKDGTWTTAPFAQVGMDDRGTGPELPVAWHTTATTLVIVYLGTPTSAAAFTYTFNYSVVK